MSFRSINNIFENFLIKISFSLIKKIFFLLSILYLIYYLFIDAKEFSFVFETDYIEEYLLLSFIFCLISIFLNGLAWKNIIIWLGGNTNKSGLISFFIVSNSLKYVPGGVWHFIERFRFLKNRISSDLAFYVTLIEPFFMLAAALFLSSIGSINNPIFIIFIIPCLFLHRDLIYYVISKLETLKAKSAKLLNLPKTKIHFDSVTNIKTVFPVNIFLIEIAFILSKFVGFLFSLYLFKSSNEFDIVLIFAIFCISWSIGLVIPAAPSGAGVFEACFLFLIGNNIMQNNVVMGLICFRLLSTFSDLFLSSAFLVKKFLK